jgi:hypothetical protein
MPRVLRGLHISNVDRTWKGRNGYSKAVLFKSVPVEKGSTEELWDDARAAVRARWGDEVWVRDITWDGTDTATGRLVYERSGDVFQVTYTTSDGAITLGDDNPIEVRTEYVPVDKGETMALDMEALDPEVRAHIEGLEAQIKEAAPTDEAIADAVEKAIGELSAEDLVGKVEGLALAEPETDPEPDIEELVKGLPEALQAEIRKGQEALTKAEKLEADAEKRHFAEIAKSMPALAEKTDEVADALRMFAKAVGGEDTDQYKLVNLGKAIGHGEDGAVLDDKDEALQQIDQLAADMVAKGLAPTTQQAKLALRDTHPALIAKALG